ncbi:MAG: hypothetical protein H6R10_700 [Rhodocyclaceae bacterium]|nr:hypothetical protein [Rhodocyclaceae bacterium]
MGATPEQLEEAREALKGRVEEFGLWPDNGLPLQVFDALYSQWRIGPFGHRLGLDYAAIPAALKLMAVKKKDWPALFADLQVLEAETILVRNL